jgi:nitrite reductase/ring-hydroxylating ferredoxin subunit/uncharacterized membrane protein
MSSALSIQTKGSAMKSKASIKGHPIHPMLVAFPIAFLGGALGFDVFGLLLRWPNGWTTGAYMSLAAIATGLLAGIPGLIDYLYVVPPDSSARRRSSKHMLINLTALGVFAASWAFRDRATLEPGSGTVLLEVFGVGLVTWGGWLGGILVYRNQIGVDHRYASAGRWNEQEVVARNGEPITIAREDELELDQMKLLRIGDRRVVLARTERGYVAFDDHCTHKGGPLSDGVLIAGTVQCPWHGSQFDVHTGEQKAGPASAPIRRYDVHVIDGRVCLMLPPEQHETSEVYSSTRRT